MAQISMNVSLRFIVKIFHSDMVSVWRTSLVVFADAFCVYVFIELLRFHRSSHRPDSVGSKSLARFCDSQQSPLVVRRNGHVELSKHRSYLLHTNANINCR